MQTLIENYINGNLTIARKQARKFAAHRIATALQMDFGFSERKAILVAHWLKTGEGWQTACDAQ